MEAGTGAAAGLAGVAGEAAGAVAATAPEAVSAAYRMAASMGHRVYAPLADRIGAFAEINLPRRAAACSFRACRAEAAGTADRIKCPTFDR